MNIQRRPAVSEVSFGGTRFAAQKAPASVSAGRAVPSALRQRMAKVLPMLSPAASAGTGPVEKCRDHRTDRSPASASNVISVPGTSR
ncbi:hypothetical protein SNARM312S_04561 [Streptomyces narbonensis]